MGPSSLRADLNWPEIELIQDSWTKIWQSYMNFFTWHFGMHMVALGAIYSTPGLSGVLVPAAVFSMALATLAIATSVCMLLYDIAIGKRMRQLSSISESVDAILGGRIIGGVRWFSIATNCLILAAWTVTLVNPPARYSALSGASLPI